LAQKNGATNVDDMLFNMSSTQFIEWQQFAQLEPFGAQVDEFQLAALRALVTNYLSSNKQNINSVNDFMLSAVERPKEREKTVEEIYQLFG